MEDTHTTGMICKHWNNSLDRGHISGLDALRTLAIGGVTLFHMFPDTIVGGYLGVSLFFVLTGYLLAYNSAREEAAGGFRVGHYYLKRVRRIYPSLLLVMLATVGIYHFWAPKVIAAIRPEALSVVLGYNNWWQIAQNADYFTRITNASPFTHLWFMGIELQYYLVWPLIFLLYCGLCRVAGEKAGLGAVVLLGAAAALLMPLLYVPGQDVTRLYYGTDTRVYALLFGAAMGLYRAGQPAQVRFGAEGGLLRTAGFVLLLGAIGAAYLFMDGQGSLLYQGGMLLMTLLFCILLGLTADAGSLWGEYLDGAFFRWVGQRSYGIFLWQYPVIFLFHYLQWDELPAYFLLELLAILLLAVWSDDVSACITKRQLPFLGHRLAIVRGTAFGVITMTGVVFMGYGCNGIAASAGYKAADQTELQTRLEEHAAALAEQNALAAEAQAAASPASGAADAARQADITGVACIGDSVMLGSSDELRQALPACYIDAEVSRYVGGGIQAAKDMEAQGRLGNIVVIALGTNGPIGGQERYDVQTRGLLAALGPTRHIFWVNVYCPELKWQNTNNACIEKIAAAHSNVTVVDWYSLIARHPEWLGDDGVHPNDEGTLQYAKLIHDRIVQVMSEAPPAA